MCNADLMIHMQTQQISFIRETSSSVHEGAILGGR